MDLENQGEKSDRASTKPSSTGSWRLYAETLEKSLERERIENREVVEALRTEHQEETKAANSKKLVLQKRVKKLLESKAGIVKDLEIQKEQAFASSRHCHEKHDKLEEKYADLWAFTSDLQQSNSENNLREEVVRLCDVAASLDSQNKELSARCQELKGQLAQSQEQNQSVVQNLQRASQDAEFYRNRMYELNYALEQKPEHYADFHHEIQMRDRRYTDLEARAGECFAKSRELEKKSCKDQKAASAAVAELNTRLGEQEAEIARLNASKGSFKRQAEEVFDMLSRRVLPSDLFDAMSEYYQLVIEDNGVLQKKVEHQMLEISSNQAQAKLLYSVQESLTEQSLQDQETKCNLEMKIRAQDIDIGRLEFKIDCLTEEHLQETQGQISAMANLQTVNYAQSCELDILARATDPSSVRNLIKSKNRLILSLHADLANLQAATCALQQNEKAREEADKSALAAACYADTELEQLKIRLRDTDAELQRLRVQMRG